MSERERISRRDMLKRSLKSLAFAGVSGGAIYTFYNRDTVSAGPAPRLDKDFTVELPDAYPDLVTAVGKSPVKNARAVLEELGGIENFISPGERVVIKPNIGWDRTPEQAANTNPELIGELTELCLKAKASEVVVTDVPCNDARRTFVRSGISEAVKEAGGTVRLPEEKLFREYNLGGSLLHNWPILETFVRADRIINVPILKHHSLTKTTIGMKNWYGILGGRRNRLHQRIEESIADLAGFIKPTLTIVDATRVLMSNGPSGGSTDDVKRFNTLFAGTDQVALDAFAAERIMNLSPSSLNFLTLSAERDIGELNYKKLNIKEITTA